MAERDFRLLLCCPRAVPREGLRVDLSEEHDREPHPEEALEQSIAATWKHRLVKQPDLFNGSKFRYGGCGEGVDGAALLRLGLTDYMTFVGTNLSSEWERFLVEDADDSRRCRHCANPLGNGAVVETADGLILTLRRSGRVGEFPGHVVFPGGHSEPEEVGIRGHGDVRGREKVNAVIAQEMFDGIVREVVEETGVPAPALHEPLFIGVSQRAVNVRPTAFFYLRCSLPAAEVQRLYADAVHSFESTQLRAISRDQLETEAQQMPGCHQGGAALYRLMRDCRA